MRRVQQEGGLAVAPDFATTIYSYCEQIANTHTQRVIDTGVLTVPKQRLLFTYRDEFADAIDIISIRQSGRRIERVDDLTKFSAYDVDWFRSIAGTRLDAWHQIGRDILILYPGLAAASTADVEYVKLLTMHTNFAASYNTDSELPDEDIELALKIAELVLLTRFRQLPAVKRLMDAFIARYAIKGIK
jgi:hypothetical protein